MVYESGSPAKNTLKVVPAPSALSTVMLAPKISTIP
jgi:hypothetical protein